MPSRLLIRLLLFMVTGNTGLLLYYMINEGKPLEKRFMLAIPADNTHAGYRFTLQKMHAYIRTKKVLQFTLDGDNNVNWKKMAFIRYECQRIKFTEDSNTVVSIYFEKEMELQFLKVLLQICEEDRHWSYSLLPNEFIIFPGYMSITEIEKRRLRQKATN